MTPLRMAVSVGDRSGPITDREVLTAAAVPEVSTVVRCARLRYLRRFLVYGTPIARALLQQIWSDAGDHWHVCIIEDLQCVHTHLATEFPMPASGDLNAWAHFIVQDGPRWKRIGFEDGNNGVGREHNGLQPWCREGVSAIGQ